MSEFKDDFWYTREQALRALRRLRKTAKPLGYTTALYGSTILDGGGHDIDLQIMGAEDQLITPSQLAIRFIRQHAKELHLYHRIDKGDMSDVWFVMLTHDNLYLDVHIKGGEF